MNKRQLAALAVSMLTIIGCDLQDRDRNADPRTVPFGASQTCQDYYDGIEHKTCKTFGGGTEVACTKDSECTGGVCDTKCGCCVATPPAMPDELCRFVMKPCKKKSSEEVYPSELDLHTGRHTGEGEGYELVSGGGDDCECPEAPDNNDSNEYFGSCDASSTDFPSQNCQWPDPDPDCPTCGAKYCVWKMKVAKSKCCSPMDASCTGPSSYSTSECGARTCSDNPVAFCDTTDGKYTLEETCVELANPS